MQVNKYHNSISEPAVRKSISIPNEQDDELTKIRNALVETQTRHLIETAMKFMRSAKRDQLSFEDLQYSLKYMGIRDIRLTYHPGSSDQSSDPDPVISNTDSFLESESKSISNIYLKPAMEGRWVYINNKVPRTEQNIHIKRYKQIKEQIAKEEDNNKFNILYDQPINLLTREEEELYSHITTSLDKDIVPGLEQSNPNNIFPFVISYLLQTEIRDAKILFLIGLLSNKHIPMLLEHHLHQILAILKNYTGPLMWEVGLQIASLVNCWGTKYLNVYEYLSKQAEGYPKLIRNLAIQAYFKIPIQVNASNLEQDISKAVPYALEYKQQLRTCFSRLKNPGAYQQLLTEGLAGLELDHFLSTML